MIMKITRTSTLTGEETTMDLEITSEQLEEYNLPPNERRLIQDIMPDLSADEREFLITGITPMEWEAHFS